MISTFLMGVVYLAIVYVLVKPSSKMSVIITDVTDGLASLTHAAITGEPFSPGGK